MSNTNDIFSSHLAESLAFKQAEQIGQVVLDCLAELIRHLAGTTPPASASASDPASTSTSVSAPSSSATPASLPSSQAARSILAPLVQGLKARIEEILPAEEPAEALSAQSEEGTSKHAAVGTSLSTSTSKRERSKSSLKEYVGAILREFVLSRVPANRTGSGEDAEEEERASKRTKVHHQHTHGDVELSPQSARALSDRLDVVLAFVDADLVDSSLPLQILEEAFEALPIKSCSLLFAYMESRLQQLTQDLSPSKGKGLTLLRLCNDLLRRLSKPSREQTIFAGRVLSTLSAVFPLGERSGVNLRGDFNTDNKTLIEPLPAAAKGDKHRPEVEGMEDDVDEKGTESGDETKAQRSIAPMDLETSEGLSTVCSSPEFYSTFWSLQSIFSNPSLLFDSSDALRSPVPEGADDPAPDGSKGPMSSLRIATKFTLRVFAAAAKREKILAGAKGSESEAARNAAKKKEEENARKMSSTARDERPVAGADFVPEAEGELDGDGAKARRRKSDDAMQTEGGDPQLPSLEARKDFFPKYLTGRKLLEYELKDPNFRRHVLVQWLILFQYLLTFTPTQRDKRKDWKNKQLQAIPFVLDDADDGWIRTCWREIIAQLKAIPPEGKTFSDSVLQTLKRESRWYLWKADNCPPIDLAPLGDHRVEEYAKASRALMKRLSNFPHEMGTAALSHLWQEGLEPPVPSTRVIDEEQVYDDGLGDLEMPLRIPTLDTYAKQIRAQELAANKRRQSLGWQAPRALPDPSLPLPSDTQQRQEVQKLVREEKERVGREEKETVLGAVEEKRRTLAWKAMRLASRQHLNLLTPAIRVDDITTLMRLAHEETTRQASEAGIDAPAAAANVDAEVIPVYIPSIPGSTLEPEANSTPAPGDEGSGKAVDADQADAQERGQGQNGEEDVAKRQRNSEEKQPEEDVKMDE